MKKTDILWQTYLNLEKAKNWNLQELLGLIVNG